MLKFKYCNIAFTSPKLVDDGYLLETPERAFLVTPKGVYEGTRDADGKPSAPEVKPETLIDASGVTFNRLKQAIELAAKAK